MMMMAVVVYPALSTMADGTLPTHASQKVDTGLALVCVPAAATTTQSISLSILVDAKYNLTRLSLRPLAPTTLALTQDRIVKIGTVPSLVVSESEQ